MASPCWGEGRPRLPASSLAPGSCSGAGGLSGARGLGGRQPAWRRTPCAVARPMASPCWGRAVCGSQRRHWCQVLVAALAASWAPAALVAGILLSNVLHARRRICWPLPDEGWAARGSRRPHRRQVREAAEAEASAFLRDGAVMTSPVGWESHQRRQPLTKGQRRRRRDHSDSPREGEVDGPSLMEGGALTTSAARNTAAAVTAGALDPRASAW